MSAEPVESPTNSSRIATTWEWMCWAVDGLGPPAPGPDRAITPVATGGHGPTRCFALALPPSAQSAHTAREFMKVTLHDRAVPDRVEDMTVTVSELVSNALRYGRAPSAGSAASQTRFSVWVGVWEQWSCAVCAVADCGDGVPLLNQADQLAESGRGLQIVAALSDAWGWAPRTGPGKAVWAMFLL